MNLIDYTTNWIKGELFEAKLIVAFGILTLIAGFLFWKTGTTPNAKALFIPFIMVGAIYSAIRWRHVILKSKTNDRATTKVRARQNSLCKI